MTPQRVAEISDEIEQLYSDMTDELLLNIAKHLNSSTWTWTALHEIETLEQMGQLTEENTKIINAYVQKIPQAVKDAMNDSRLEALSEVEGKLAQAALNGYLVAPVTDSTVEVTKAFSAQALSQLNLVNQTMLNSSLQAYQTGVYTMRQGMQTIADAAELEEAQEIIDFATGKTVLGTETRTGALRTALRQLNANGITGFIDRAGRSWSAEGYVNMDIRTTVHNTYIQSVKSRQEDYGSDVFQVSAHAGARPLCYPYQGKLYSWGNSGGYITLGDGKRYRFGSIRETSYGQPAGLFGINCGHVPYPMIPGVSEKVDEPIQSKAENDRQYKESQQQRYLERKIRYQKRELEMLGDNATEADRQRLRDAQAQMRDFIKQTGRTRRYDREQIVTESEKRKLDIQGKVAVEIYPKGKIDPKVSQTFTNEVLSTSEKYKVQLNAIHYMDAAEAKKRSDTAAYVNPITHELKYNPLYTASQSTMEEIAKEEVESGRWVKVAEKDYVRYTAVHESKHLILDVQMNTRHREPRTPEEHAAKEITELYKKYRAHIGELCDRIIDTGDDYADAELKRILISDYSMQSPDEFMAEGMTMQDIGLSTNEYSQGIAEILDRYMRR